MNGTTIHQSNHSLFAFFWNDIWRNFFLSYIIRIEYIYSLCCNTNTKSFYHVTPSLPMAFTCQNTLRERVLVAFFGLSYLEVIWFFKDLPGTQKNYHLKSINNLLNTVDHLRKCLVTNDFFMTTVKLAFYY